MADKQGFDAVREKIMQRSGYSEMQTGSTSLKPAPKKTAKAKRSK